MARYAHDSNQQEDMGGRPDAPWWQKLNRKTSTDMRTIYSQSYKVGVYAESVCTDKKILADIQERAFLSILFYGPSGAGKSSLINSILRAIQDDDEWNPVAPMNDEEVGRMQRTVTYRRFAAKNRDRSEHLGQVELWDCQGVWNKGNPEFDFKNIRHFKNTGVAEGDVVPFQDFGVRQSIFGATAAERDGRPDVERRKIDMVVFVVDPSNPADVIHLARVVELMIMATLLPTLTPADYHFQVVCTKVDSFMNDWSNLDDTRRLKLDCIAVNDTWAIENYKDRNIFYVFFKLLLAAELSVAYTPRRKRVMTPIDWIAVSAVLIAALLIGLYFFSASASPLPNPSSEQ